MECEPEPVSPVFTRRKWLAKERVRDIFRNDKATLESRSFEIQHLPQGIGIDAIKNLAQCRTTTFLKKIANAVVAAKISALGEVVRDAPGAESKQAAVRQILDLAGEERIRNSPDTQVQAGRGCKRCARGRVEAGCCEGDPRPGRRRSYSSKPGSSGPERPPLSSRRGCMVRARGAGEALYCEACPRLGQR